MQLTYI